MASEFDPDDPYDRDHLRNPIRTHIGERRSPAEMDDGLPPNPELAEAPVSNGRIALVALGIAIALGLVFYGLNNTSMTQQNAVTTLAPSKMQKSATTSPLAAPPGMRDAISPSNSRPGTTTGSAATPAQNLPSAPANNVPANNSK